MGRYIDITGAPIASDFQEMPLDFMSKALDVKQKSLDTYRTKEDALTDLLNPQGGIRTQGEGKKVYEKYAPEVDKIAKEAIANPQEAARKLSILQKRLASDKGYQAIKADEAASKDVRKQMREFEAKGELPAYRDLYTYTPEGPKLNKYTYEQLTSGEVDTTPEDWYNYTASQDVAKYVKDEYLDKLKAEATQRTGEDIVNLVEDGSGGLQAMTKSGKTISLDENTPWVRDTLITVGQELQKGNTPHARYFKNAQPMGLYTGYENFSKGIIPEDVDKSTKNAIGFVRSLLYPYKQKSTESSKTYTGVQTAKDRADLANENISTATTGSYLGEKEVTGFNLRKDYKTLSISRDDLATARNNALSAMNKENLGNLVNLYDPSKSAAQNAATLRQAAQRIASPGVKTRALELINKIEDSQNQINILDKGLGEVQDKFNYINNTIYDRARNSIINDSSLTPLQKEKELKEITYWKANNLNKLKQADNPEDIGDFDIFKSGNKYLQGSLDNYKKDFYTGEQNKVIPTLTMNIAPKSQEKKDFDVIKNRVETGELKVEGKGGVPQKLFERLKDQGFKVKSANVSSDVIKYDSQGNAYLTIEVEDVDGNKRSLEQKVILDDNFINTTNNALMKLANSPDKAVADQATLGLVNNSLYLSGNLKKINDVDLTGQTTLNIDGTSITITKTGSKYMTESNGNTNYFNSLNDIKLSLVE
jgi:hypothetical protein